MKVSIDVSGEITGVPNSILMYGAIVWGDTIIDAPDDYSPMTYDFIAGEFIPKVLPPEINLAARRQALEDVGKYVFNEFTEAHRNQFSQDIAALSAGYVLGGNRLVTWIQTTQGNGVNYTTSGFRTKTYGSEIRQQHILSLLV